ncbi:unnamed protein product [Chironomus riparius]|uniref:Biogenesis of lysosome-related organelles complex 1 subunit 3 n=1 Tax=Chironomus riparius TaxID=315576 RepID=A0A9N9RSB6_9DIPT|nr:unnamed protein product [Chironomus riparius]
MTTSGEAPETDSEDEQYVFNSSYAKIGNETNLECPNVAVNSSHDIIIKGKVVEGLSEAEDLLNTPLGTEITESFSPLHVDPLRKRINELSTITVKNFIQERIAPISKKIMDTDNSLINTQLTLQNVSTSMKNASERSTRINTKFQTVISSDFLPQINRLYS